MKIKKNKGGNSDERRGIESEGKRLWDGGRATMLIALVESKDITQKTAEEAFGGTYEEIVAAANKGKCK